MTTCEQIAPLWWQLHPPVGFFIAILAVFGVLVPLFRSWEVISRREKAAWTLLMFILVGLEIRTLYRERAEHDREQEFARCQQLRSFESIADSLKSAITISQGQYQSTLKHVDGVLKTTEDVSRLAKKSLDNLTGGESFGYVIPNIGSTSDFHKATGAGGF